MSMHFGHVSRQEFRSLPVSHAPTVFMIAEEHFVWGTLLQLIHRSGWQATVLESPRELIGEPRPIAPSCLLLPFHRADSDLRLQKEVAQERPEIPIIVMSWSEDLPTAVQAMKAGAVDVLVRPFRDDALVGAIRQGLELSEAAVGERAAVESLRERYASLSLRERQVMALVVEGRLNKVVGWDLGISEITVKAHRGRVMQKMNAASLPDLVRMAARIDLAGRMVRRPVSDSSRDLRTRPNAVPLREPQLDLAISNA